MRPKIRHLNLALSAGSAALGIASIAMRDADKAPLYFLLAYVLWRIP